MWNWKERPELRPGIKTSYGYTTLHKSCTRAVDMLCDNTTTGGVWRGMKFVARLQMISGSRPCHVAVFLLNCAHSRTAFQRNEGVLVQGPMSHRGLNIFDWDLTAWLRDVVAVAVGKQVPLQLQRCLLPIKS
jgi:hypothetical protein